MGLVNQSPTYGGGHLVRPQTKPASGGMGGAMGGGMGGAPSAPMGAPLPASARAPSAGGSSPRITQGMPPRSTTQLNMPAYQPPPPPQNYQRYNPQASPVGQDLRELSGRGSDLMDPNSAYYKELVSQMRGDIGKSTAAAKRSAALEGAEFGFGAGASPEMMENMERIGEAGRIAEGNAMGDITLAAPQIGAGMMASTFGPGAQLQGIGEQSGQFGAGLREAGVMGRAGMAEGARQFGAGLGLEQQRMADERAMREAAMQNENARWEAEFGLREDQLAAEYGGGLGGYGDDEDLWRSAVGAGGIGY